ELDDLDPVRALAGRILADQLERAGAVVDRVRRNGRRKLARDDEVAPGRVDREATRLLLGRRASEVGELFTFDAQRIDRAASALGGVEEPAIRREVQVRRPDVVVDVASGTRARRARLLLAVGGQRGVRDDLG